MFSVTHNNKAFPDSPCPSVIMKKYFYSAQVYNHLSLESETKIFEQ